MAAFLFVEAFERKYYDKLGEVVQRYGSLRPYMMVDAIMDTIGAYYTKDMSLLNAQLVAVLASAEFDQHKVPNDVLVDLRSTFLKFIAGEQRAGAGKVVGYDGPFQFDSALCQFRLMYSIPTAGCVHLTVLDLLVEMLCRFTMLDDYAALSEYLVGWLFTPCTHSVSSSAKAVNEAISIFVSRVREINIAALVNPLR